MIAKTGKTSDEAQIRGLIEDWVKALRARDIDGVMANYASDVVVFDIDPPLHYEGADKLRAKWEGMFKSFKGPIDYRVQDVEVIASDETAFSHSLNFISATGKDGKKTQTWLRATICYKKIDGNWRVTHEHVSVPFDPETGQASLELEP